MTFGESLLRPEVAEDASEHPAWRVRSKSFAWDRPLRRADVHDLGATPPDGPIVSVYVARLGEKEALIATETPTVFGTPHFDGLSGSTGWPSGRW